LALVATFCATLAAGALAHPQARGNDSTAFAAASLDGPSTTGSTGGGYDPYGIWAIPWSGRPETAVTDANGIPMVDYGGKLGVQYNAGTIAATFGLTYFNTFIREHQQQDLAFAVRMGNWLVKNQSRRGAWLYHFPWILPAGGGTLRNPWPSAYSSGAAISLLVRLWKVTGNRAYLRAALKGLKPFSTNTAHGGVTDYVFGHPVYEEYPYKEPPATLNGFMVSLVGLYDLSRAAPKSPARRLFRTGYNSLVALISYWDAGCTQFYWLLHLTSAKPRPAYLAPGIGYKTVDPQLLDVLISVHPNKKLSFYADLWRKEIGTTSCNGY